MARRIVNRHRYWFEWRKFNFILQGEGRMRWAGGAVRSYQLSWSASWGERSSKDHLGTERASVRPRKPVEACFFRSYVLNIPEAHSGHSVGRVRASLDCPFSRFIFTSWVHLKWKGEGHQRPFPLWASNSRHFALEESHLKKHSLQQKCADPTSTRTWPGPPHWARNTDREHVTGNIIILAPTDIFSNFFSS